MDTDSYKADWPHPGGSAPFVQRLLLLQQLLVALDLGHELALVLSVQGTQLGVVPLLSLRMQQHSTRFSQQVTCQ